MPRQQKNFRLPELTRQELQALCGAFGMTESEIIILAIDTLFHRQSPESLQSHAIENKRELLRLIVSGEATADPVSTPLAEKLPPELLDRGS